MLRFIHAADFHLDSRFAALRPEQAAARRRESRESCFRFADYVNSRDVDVVLLAGDLFDSTSAFRETGEILREALGRIQTSVVIAPGNHDWYGPDSPYMKIDWPDHVHIFKRKREQFFLPQKNAVIHGGAFTGPEQTESLLYDFVAPEDGNLHLMLLHGDAGQMESRYNPIDKKTIASTGLHYLALGHVHKPGQLRAGRTLCAWPGCLEGRGFDELGDRGFYEGTIREGEVSLRFVPFARRRYEILEVDITGQKPLAAIQAALPEDTTEHLYRIVLRGETDARGIEVTTLQDVLAERFYALELRDHTQVRQDIWAGAGEDTLRGLFLKELQNKMIQAETQKERERISRAIRFGLAALDHRDLG